MNRLKKIANADNCYEIEEALVNLIFTDDGSNLMDLYNEIANDDPECLYNGMVYRILYLDYKKLINNINTKKDKNGIYVKCEELVEEIYNNIYSGDWQSTTKSLDNVNSLELEITVSNPISVVIGFNCKNGVDLQKLCQKYLKIFEKDENNDVYIRELKEMIDISSTQQEIYAKIPNNYEIFTISDMDIDNFTGTVNILNLEI